MRFPLVLLTLAACTPKQTAPAPTGSAAASAAPSASAAARNDCGALDCHLYDSAADAMGVILADKPLVIAIGEAHAQKGSEGVASSAKRFTDELLPLLKGRASDLLVELMMPPKGCEAKTKEVRKRQEPVTQKQAATDQNEYVTMGNAARGLGVVPDLLRPSCEDFDAVTKATGAEAVAKMLETIKRLTVSQVKALLARKDHDAEKAIVVYGGAFHGDPNPPASRAAYSFAGDLAPAVGGRYVYVNLFVPEFITDDESWKQFEWYAHYDKSAHPEKVTTFHPRADTYVIIFAATR
jgi:hypothetical protein